MTVEELYKFCVRNGYEDKEIKININCSDDYYSVDDVPLKASDLIFAENVEICISC